ncbi:MULTISPECIES: transglycosylase SLT domain-containing protein [Streptomyces]|uniref:aggregation-promoting factor C-terminal-like domain-containing protein n=2 Tax=Streptomyces TaxID=1883 RepID=UPI000D51BB1C|nr:MULTISPECIES: transglycosylase SLT domain-containing protein [Streptomyces]MXG24890.1 lytic transglycosylase domain-containing protein [Streptomyces sp. YIM 132580]NYS18730.1 lytic transglycosylase domain-containing protein [Streptomyces sp. SJ1-7]PVC72737.1 transglycosylase domain-containing protein [Streptomyces sp. CS065A]
MSRISVRGFAVASATAVTTVGAVVGVAAGGAPAADDNNFEAAAADTTLLADIPAGQQAQVQTASLTQQADAQASAADAAAKKSAEESARLQAAKDAKSKKADAEAKAEAEREAAEKAKKEKEASERASRSSVRDASSFSAQGSYTVAQVQAMARQMVPADQFQCFSNIVNHESTWNYRATNASSGAYGLMQALPGHKMASAGADWQSNPATQIKWGLSYMDGRYGSPCGAWSFWQANNWY